MIKLWIRCLLILISFSFFVIYSNAQVASGNNKKRDDSICAVRYYFFSDAIFNQTLKSKKLSSSCYSIIVIQDSVSTFQRKRSGVILKDKLIIPFEYDSILYVTGNEFICRKQTVSRRSHAYNYVIIDTKEGMLIDAGASNIHPVAKHIYSITANHKQYFFNSITGARSQSFDSYVVFDSTYLLVRNSEEYLLYDDSSKLFIRNSFKEIVKNDSLYTLSFYSKWDIYQHTGTILFNKLNADSVYIDSISQTWKIYRNKSIFFRKNCIPPSTSYALYNVLDNRSPIQDTGVYNNLKRKLQPDTILFTSDGLFLYKKNKQYGYCDSIGNIKITHQYDTLTPWNDDMALIRFKRKWGYINKRERLCVQPYYIIAFPFYEGSAAVYDSKRWSFINKEGKPVNSLNFDSIQQTPSGRWYVFSKGKTGLCDTNGKELLPPSFDDIYDLGSDLIVYKSANMYGLILKDRTIISKPVYDYFIADKLNNCYILRYPQEAPIVTPDKRN